MAVRILVEMDYTEREYFRNLTPERVEEAMKLFQLRMDRGSDILLMGPLFNMIRDKAEGMYRLFPAPENPAWLPWMDALQKLICAADQLAMMVEHQEGWVGE